jgi:hypothetical protein
VNALRRIHRSLARGGVLLDLQPMLANAPVVLAGRVLGRLDEREFRATADQVNLALDDTVRAGLFAHERELDLDVVHRFGDAAELLSEIGSWTGTTVPAVLRRRLERSKPPFEVHEGAKLRRFRVL